MLIDFSVRNFRSIKDKQVFSMQPLGKVKELEVNTFKSSSKQFLKTSIIYGGNASGKSNLILAMRALSYLVKSSSLLKNEDMIPAYEPFLLDHTAAVAPVEFEINFIAKNGIRYNYVVSFSKKEILHESLYFYPGSQPAKLFDKKSGSKISIGESLGGDISNIEAKLLPNQLLLSKSANEKIESLEPVHAFFRRHFFVFNSSSDFAEQGLIRSFTKRIHKNKSERVKDNVNQLLQFADIGITGISIKEHSEEEFNFPKDLDDRIKRNFVDENRLQVRSHHDVYSDGKVVGDIGFSLDQESKGTQKLLAIGSMFIEGLRDGDVVIVDELDNSLHPMLTRALVNMFHSPRTNPKNAQLIFASHDVSLLSAEIFRRDQIYFAEKNSLGYSMYHSLGDIKGVRKGLSYEKYYMRGAFGGTPVLNEFFLNFNFEEDEKL